MTRSGHMSHPPPPDRAFIGLDAYREIDADWFTGREDEVEQIQTLVQDYPFVLLTGYAGVGKTSLIQAALLPRWRADGWHCVYLSFSGLFGAGMVPLSSHPLAVASRPTGEQAGARNPTLGLRDFLGQLAGESSPPGATFESAFERIAQRHDEERVLIAFDRVELLAWGSPDIASDLYRALQSAAAGRWPNLRVLIVFRGDAEPDVGPPLQRIAGLVGGPPRCYLSPLLADDAERILRAGFEAAGVKIEDDALLPAVLAELQTQPVARDAHLTVHLVFPHHLQMVGQTLCQLANDNDGVLASAMYDELGGVQAILDNYVTRQLERFDERRKDAEKVLVGLVRLGRQGERQLQDATGLKAELTEDDWSQLMSDLAAARLVRLVDDSRGVGQVEVVHELLAEMVERETVRQERELRRLRGALALRAAAQEQGPVPLRPGVMAELYLWRERIVPNPSELRLLLNNGLMERGPVWFWLRRMSLLGLRPFLTLAYESTWPGLHRAGGLALAAAATLEDALTLHRLLEDVDPQVRKAAARALIEIIPEMGWDEALVLRFLIEVPDADVRRAAAQALALVLAQVGRDIIPDIPLLLRDEDPEVRFIADETLSRVVDRQDIPFLRQMLQDEDLDVLNSAWGALTQVLSQTPTKDLSDLLALLADEDLYVQGAAREALTQIIGQMGPEDEALLRELSQSDDPNVRREAALAFVGGLAEQGPDAIPTLRSMLDDWNADVRHAAGRALADALASLAAVEAPTDGGTDVMAELRAMMDTPDRPLRLASAQVMTRLLAQAGRDAIPDLCELLNERDPEVCLVARKALEEVLAQVGREAIPDLQAMLKDPNWDVWQAAGLALARVLSELGRPGLRDLRGLLKQDEDPKVRRAGGQALAGVLSELGRVSLPELRMMLKDDDLVVRRAGGRALARVLEKSGTRGLSDLRWLLENEDPEIHESAQQALINVVTGMGRDALPVLRDMVAESSSGVREPAQVALGRVVSQLGRRVIPYLREMLQDRYPFSRHAAAAAIAALDPVRGLEAWCELVVAYPLDNEEATRALVALDRELYCPFSETWTSRAGSVQSSVIGDQPSTVTLDSKS